MNQTTSNANKEEFTNSNSQNSEVIAQLMAARTIWNFYILAELRTFQKLESSLGFPSPIRRPTLLLSVGDILSHIRAHIENGSKEVEETEELNDQSIPFLILMDMCSSGGHYNLSASPATEVALTNEIYRSALDIGRLYYAVKPGENIGMFELPCRLHWPEDLVWGRSRKRLPILGPLAIHLRKAMANRHLRGPLTLTMLHEMLMAEEPGIPSPFAIDAPLRADVRNLEFFQASDGVVFRDCSRAAQEKYPPNRKPIMR